MFIIFNQTVNKHKNITHDFSKLLGFHFFVRTFPDMEITVAVYQYAWFATKLWERHVHADILII